MLPRNVPGMGDCSSEQGSSPDRPVHAGKTATEESNQTLQVSDKNKPAWDALQNIIQPCISTRVPTDVIR